MRIEILRLLIAVASSFFTGVAVPRAIENRPRWLLFVSIAAIGWLVFAWLTYRG